MAQFLIQFRYESAALKRLVDRPEIDRAAEAAALIASLGGNLLGYWYALGDFDGVVLIEAPDTSVPAAVAMAVGGSGEVARIQTTALLTITEARRAMQTAATATHLPSGAERQG